MKNHFISIHQNQSSQKNEIDEFEKKTIELNKNGEGDQAEFYLQKVSEITSA